MNEVVEVNTSEINYQILSNDDLLRINIVLKKIIETEKKISDKLDPEIANAYKTHKGLTALKKQTLEPFVNAREKINQSIKIWHIELEKQAKELQEKINKQLAEQAEKERQRQLKEASKVSDEWDREELEEKAKNLVPDTVDLKVCQESTIVKQEGQYKRSNWKAKVINAHLVPSEYWILDQSKLDKKAKELQLTDTIPGCEIYDDFTIVTKI